MTDPMRGVNYDAWKLATPDDYDEPEPEPELCDECAGMGWLPLSGAESGCCEACGGSGEV